MYYMDSETGSGMKTVIVFFFWVSQSDTDTVMLKREILIAIPCTYPKSNFKYSYMIQILNIQINIQITPFP